MNGKRFFFYRISLIFLSIGLALMSVSVIVVLADGSGPRSITISNNGRPSAPGSVSGEVFYTGTITGTHLVWIGAFTSTQGGPPVFSVMRDGPGPYTLADIAEGVYYIKAGMDADDSGGQPDPAVDPMGSYLNNPITITDGVVITGVDITLVDPTPPPTGTGSILGWISYTGPITPSHQIIIFATRLGDQSPSYSTVISSAGAYTITNVAAYTYTVGAFMDLDDDMGPPEPDEPFGWYDPLGDGVPDPVVVYDSLPSLGIDIILLDPLRYLFLPLVSKVFMP
jgi:hypothetical protein